MEKTEMIKNVRAMMDFADKKMKGVVKEDITYQLEWSPYHYIKFAFYPNKQGSCIEFGSHGGTYTRLFANITTRHGGWCGGEEVCSYEQTNRFVLRDDMMRAAMLQWGAIKDCISRAVEKENAIDNFTL